MDYVSRISNVRGRAGEENVNRAEIENQADDFFRRLDSNGDGEVGEDNSTHLFQLPFTYFSLFP